jgi:hypothetical protein
MRLNANDVLMGMQSRVYADLLCGRQAGLTPKPAFWSLLEQTRIDNTRVLCR